MGYKTYAEAKIANPDSDIFTNDKDFKAAKDAPTSHFLNGWAICNPVDYCMTLEDFIGKGFKLVVGDKIITIGGDVLEIKNKNTGYNDNFKDDHKRYILSASTLNGGCKIPAKSEQWTVYNNTLPLCELTDEQATMLFNAWRNNEYFEAFYNSAGWQFRSIDHELRKDAIYRIKPKSERELFIDKSKLIIGATTDDELVDAVIADLFDAGARYKDLTHHFGENI